MSWQSLIKIKLIGTASNRSAIGTRIIATYGDKRQAKEVTAQSSFFSVNDKRLHFGLGKHTTVDLAIRWPDGHREEYLSVPSDQIVTIRENYGFDR